MAERFSNYEKMKNEMANVFLRYNQKEMIRKFALKSDEAYLYLTFVGQGYRIDRCTGDVQRVNGCPADYNEAMTIYDVLCSSKPGSHAAGTFVNMNALSAVQTGSLSGNGSFFQQTIKFFEGRVPSFCHACKSLGGIEEPGGDAAFRIELFPFLPIILRFWDADEEFSASLQILVDKNILDFMHYETMMFALSHVMQRMTEI